MGIYKFCGNREQYAICIIGLGGMDDPAILPFYLTYAHPNLFPYHMHSIPHHTPLPLILSYLPTLPPFHLPLPVVHPPPLHLSATLSQHPSFLLLPTSPFFSPSPTCPHLSLSLPRSNLILLLLCFPHV